MESVPAITVQQLSAALASATPPQLLDVREDAEVAASRIEGSLHIPLQQLPMHLTEIDPNRPVAVICRSGGRSARAAAFLAQAGFNASNVTGGMLAWRAEIAPSLPPVL